MSNYENKQLLEKLYSHYSSNEITKFNTLVTSYPELLNIYMNNMETLLYLAVKEQKLAWVKRMLKCKRVNLKFGDWMGEHPLAEALRNDNFAITKALVEAGADVNEVNDSRLEALEIAVPLNNVEIAELLIKKGAKVKKYEEIINSIESREMADLFSANMHIFSEKGLEYWEEQKLALLLNTYTESGTNNE